MTLYTFVASQGRWMREVLGTRAVELETLRVVTWNVWFEERAALQRRRALASMLESLDADVVALQEVTDPLLQALLAEPWLRERYGVSTLSIAPRAYDVVLLSALPVARVVLTELPTMMGRRLHTLEINTVAGRLGVASVHLESTRELSATRLAQIDICARQLANYDDAVLMGDLNHEASSSESAALARHGFIDAWPRLHTSPGLTRDPTLNGLARNSAPRRIDYVLTRSSRWTPSAISLLGRDPVDEERHVWVSDHFGVCCDLALQ